MFQVSPRTKNRIFPRLNPLRFFSTGVPRFSAESGSSSGGKFHDRSGFTLIELIIFSAIFSLVSIIFVAMLVSITTVQLRQTASSEVNRQSQFVLQTIQRYIENSSFIETTSTPSQSLLLRMPTGSNGTSSQVEIYWETSTLASAIYLRLGTSTPEAITSPKVVVDELTFQKFSRPNAHDSVSFVMALSYHASSTGKKFFQRLVSTASRVSAATFDTSIIPAAQTPDLTLGKDGSEWASINDLLFFPDGSSDIYFTGGNFGIGTNAPTKKLHVIGDSLFNGAVIIDNLTLPNNLILEGGVLIGDPADICNENNRGLVKFKKGVTSDDELQICMLIEGSYQWRTPSTTAAIL